MVSPVLRVATALRERRCSPEKKERQASVSVDEHIMRRSDDCASFSPRTRRDGLDLEEDEMRKTDDAPTKLKFEAHHVNRPHETAGVDDINRGDEAGFTPLMEAAMADSAGEVMVLVLAGATVNQLDSNKGSALHYAARAGVADVVVALLRPGAVVDKRNALGLTPLLVAADAGSAEVVVALLQAGVDVAKCDRAGRTTLMAAAGSGSVGSCVRKELYARL